MGLFYEFMSQYGLTLISSVLTALAGFLGMAFKRIYTKYVNDRTKESVVKTVVRAVEQIYAQLGGEEKLAKAVENASQMLSEKGVSISELELRMLIEAAVLEYNSQL